MKIPFFKLRFKCHINKKPFVISADSNTTAGMIMTVYYNYSPIFNMVADKGVISPSPRKFNHEWFSGNLRWEVVPYKKYFADGT